MRAVRVFILLVTIALVGIACTPQGDRTLDDTELATSTQNSPAILQQLKPGPHTPEPVSEDDLHTIAESLGAADLPGEEHCYVVPSTVVSSASHEVMQKIIPGAAVRSENADPANKEPNPGRAKVWSLPEDESPTAAAQRLRDNGIPAAPLHIVLPTQKWKFGPGSVAVGSTETEHTGQGTLPDAEGGTVVVIDTGTPKKAPVTSSVSNWQGIVPMKFAETESPNLPPEWIGHGIFIGGIVDRLVEGTTLSVRSATENYRGTEVFDEQSLVDAIDAAIADGELQSGGVVNLSLGTYACGTDDLPLVLATRLAEIAESGQDIAFVAATGNDGHGPDGPAFYPAGFADAEAIGEVLATLQQGREGWEAANPDAEWDDIIDPNGEIGASIKALETLKEALDPTSWDTGGSAPIIAGVGALAYDGTAWVPAQFSNQRAATVWAPGAAIVSAYPGLDSDYAQWDGTSFATPHVAAIIAGCRSDLTYRGALAELFDEQSDLMTKTDCKPSP
ncbi:MAG: S8/S53 family peptidase [Actinomycetota bacterium]